MNQYETSGSEQGAMFFTLKGNAVKHFHSGVVLLSISRSFSRSSSLI